jgi:hypothetical protein
MRFANHLGDGTGKHNRERTPIGFLRTREVNVARGVMRPDSYLIMASWRCTESCSSCCRHARRGFPRSATNSPSHSRSAKQALLRKPHLRSLWRSCQASQIRLDPISSSISTVAKLRMPSTMLTRLCSNTFGHPVCNACNPWPSN